MAARLDRLPPNHPSSPAYRRARDARQQADQQPERPRPWYTPHTTREHAIEHQRRDQAPHADPQRWRDQWYRQQHGEIPAMFRQDVAQQVPDTSQRTKARLDRHDSGTGLPLESGSRTGLVDALRQHLGKLPHGFTNFNKTHAEAHAAAYLWLNPHIREITVYLNRAPCRIPTGCHRNLPSMIPEGRTVTLYAPNGEWRIYHGIGRIEGNT